MYKFINRSILLLSCVLILTVMQACEKQGPAEKAGEAVDNAIENTKDAIEQDGVAEEAGEKIDKAVDKVKKKLDQE